MLIGCIEYAVLAIDLKGVRLEERMLSANGVLICTVSLSEYSTLFIMLLVKIEMML